MDVPSQDGGSDKPDTTNADEVKVRKTKERELERKRARGELNGLGCSRSDAETIY
jgi:hypothetical protein